MSCFQILLNIMFCHVFIHFSRQLFHIYFKLKCDGGGSVSVMSLTRVIDKSLVGVDLGVMLKSCKTIWKGGLAHE